MCVSIKIPNPWIVHSQWDERSSLPPVPTPYSANEVAGKPGIRGKRWQRWRPVSTYATKRDLCALLGTYLFFFCPKWADLECRNDCLNSGLVLGLLALGGCNHLFVTHTLLRMIAILSAQTLFRYKERTVRIGSRMSIYVKNARGEREWAARKWQPTIRWGKVHVPLQDWGCCAFTWLTVGVSVSTFRKKKQEVWRLRIKAVMVCEWYRKTNGCNVLLGCDKSSSGRWKCAARFCPGTIALPVVHKRFTRDHEVFYFRSTQITYAWGMLGTIRRSITWLSYGTFKLMHTADDWNLELLCSHLRLRTFHNWSRCSEPPLTLWDYGGAAIKISCNWPFCSLKHTTGLEETSFTFGASFEMDWGRSCWLNFYSATVIEPKGTLLHKS